MFIDIFCHKIITVYHLSNLYQTGRLLRDLLCIICYLRSKCQTLMQNSNKSELTNKHNNFILKMVVGIFLR